jgi:hypothetical protein
MGSKRAHSIDSLKAASAFEVQRQELFKAMAVVDMCRFACASKFTGFDPEQMADALVVVQDLMAGVVSALEEAFDATRVGGAS